MDDLGSALSENPDMIFMGSSRRSIHLPLAPQYIGYRDTGLRE